ncbi:MAG: Cof-type HAD-IIB family hydrolase [Oscillospiraceae bacterium]|jgi:Cof subfamily protein (haloacid dehalogenase superfamily)|nr:Cof-type HAD-IIB family hydrolase [Oscillospiraceae bacterium]
MSAKFKGYLLAADLDGTSITSDFIIPQSNLEAVEYFKSEGGLFTVATGRFAGGAEQYVKQLKPNIPCVILNGAAIYDFEKNEIIWDMNLPEASIQYMQELTQQFPSLGLEILAGNELYATKSNEFIDIHMKNEDIEYIPASFETVPKPWYKALFAGAPEEIDAISEHCKAAVHSGVRYVRSSPNYFEMLPEGVNKGVAVKVLAERYGIEHSKLCCIGDFYNDVEMLEEAGISAATANAPQELKALTTVTVCHCNQGAIAAFVKYINETLEVI